MIDALSIIQENRIKYTIWVILNLFQNPLKDASIIFETLKYSSPLEALP